MTTSGVSLSLNDWFYRQLFELVHRHNLVYKHLLGGSPARSRRPEARPRRHDARRHVRRVQRARLRPDRAAAHPCGGSERSRKCCTESVCTGAGRRVAGHPGAGSTARAIWRSGGLRTDFLDCVNVVQRPRAAAARLLSLSSRPGCRSPRPRPDVHLWQLRHSGRDGGALTSPFRTADGVSSRTSGSSITWHSSRCVATATPRGSTAPTPGRQRLTTRSGHACCPTVKRWCGMCSHGRRTAERGSTSAAEPALRRRWPRRSWVGSAACTSSTCRGALLDIARRRIADRRWSNVQAARGDVTTWRPSRGSADVVTLSYALTMIPDWFRAVERTPGRCYVPGATLGLVEGRSRLPYLPFRAPCYRFVGRKSRT